MTINRHRFKIQSPIPDKMGFFDRFRSKKRKPKKQSNSGADYFHESNKDGNLF